MAYLDSSIGNLIMLAVFLDIRRIKCCFLFGLS